MDKDNIWTVLIAVLGGSAITGTIAAIFKGLKERSAARGSEGKTAFDSLQTLVDRQEKRIFALETALTSMQVAHEDCLRENGQMKFDLGVMQTKLGRMEVAVAAAVGLIVVDDRGMIEEWNAATSALLHWDKNEMMGKPITTIIPERYLERHLHAFQALVAERKAPQEGKVYHLQAKTKDGGELDVKIRLSGWITAGRWCYAGEISRF